MQEARSRSRTGLPAREGPRQEQSSRQESGFPQKVSNLSQKFVPPNVRHAGSGHEHQVDFLRQASSQLSVRCPDSSARPVPYNGTADLAAGYESRLPLPDIGTETEKHNVPGLEDFALLVYPLKVALAPKSLPDRESLILLFHRVSRRELAAYSRLYSPRNGIRAKSPAVLPGGTQGRITITRPTARNNPPVPVPTCPATQRGAFFPFSFFCSGLLCPAWCSSSCESRESSCGAYCAAETSFSSHILHREPRQSPGPGVHGPPPPIILSRELGERKAQKRARGGRSKPLPSPASRNQRDSREQHSRQSST